MKIGLIAPPWVSVPPTRYGGTEVVIDVLARGLQAAGHDVRLFATGDSTCAVPRRWHFETALGTTEATTVNEGAHVVAAYEELADCDVIHDHTLLGGLYGAGLVDAPVAMTNHGPFVPATTGLLAVASKRAALVAISDHQRSTAVGLDVETVIHHGLDLDHFPVGDGDGGYVLFLGRMSPDKGVDRAIVAARAAGRRLVIAAKMWEADERRYFTEVVEPMLGDDAVFVGQVGGAAKMELLGGAACLLNPIRWPEPFGLVMIEALACGTPVVTFPEGAAPEIVDEGVTGHLVGDAAEMAAALTGVDRLSRAACRRAVEERFSAERMVNRHVELYETLVARRAAERTVLRRRTAMRVADQGSRGSVRSITSSASPLTETSVSPATIVIR